MQCEKPILFQYLSADFNFDHDDSEFIRDKVLLDMLNSRKRCFFSVDPLAQSNMSESLLEMIDKERKADELDLAYDFHLNRTLSFDYLFTRGYLKRTRSQTRVDTFNKLRSLGYKVRTNIVRCRKCRSCLALASKELGLRMAHELESHKEACWLTITYDNDHCDVNKSPALYKLILSLLKKVKTIIHHNPSGVFRKKYTYAQIASWLRKKKGQIKLQPNVLDYFQIQDFLKLFRKSIDRKIRYSVVGEYGEKNGRMHWHMFVYGWQPSDLKVTRRRRSSRDGVKKFCYESPFLTKLWKKGFINVDVGLSSASAYYTSNYCLKKFNAKNSDRAPIFRQSLGLGKDWLVSNLKKILSGDLIDINIPKKDGSCLSFERKKVPVPSSYINFIKRVLDRRKDYDGVSERRLKLREIFYKVADRKVWFSFFLNRSNMALEKAKDYNWKKSVDSALFWVSNCFNDFSRRQLEV